MDANQKPTSLCGLGPTLCLSIRRDWVFWALWVFMLMLMMPLTLTQYDKIIPSGTDAQSTITPLVNNPTLLALLGPADDLSTKGAFVFWRSGGFATVIAGMMAGFGIVRSTRAEEEAGRLELVRAGRVDLHAPLAAAIITALGACLILGILNMGALIALGLPVAGSIAAGLALTLNGALFVGVGATFAQVFDSAKEVRWWTIGVGLGGMFLLRAIFDGAGPKSTLMKWHWAVPLEWVMLAQPYSRNRWWVFLLPLALSCALIGLAFWLEARRDLGAGLRAPGIGPATASVMLPSPIGLSWRLQRTGIIGWTIGLLLTSVMIGAIGIQVGSVFTDNPQMAQIVEHMGGTSNLVVAFNLGMLGIIGAVIAAMSVSILGALRHEESCGHVELLLSTPMRRTQLICAYLLWGTLVPGLLLVTCASALVLPQVLSTHQWDDLATYAGTGLALLPGLLLVAGVAAALLGLWPGGFALSWVLVGWSVFLTWFGAVFSLPEWALKMEPWGYLTKPPRDPMDWKPFVVEAVVAAALVLIGIWGYRRRDIGVA